jgi:hypothetical protein
MQNKQNKQNKQRNQPLVNLVPKPAIVNNLTKRVEGPLPKLLILRGAPGSGKTTIANTMFPTWKSVCADDYFTKPDGSYHFNPKFLDHAHSNCFDRVKIFLLEGHNVVVHNTFRTLDELNKYKCLKEIADIRIYRVISQFASLHAPSSVVIRHNTEYEPCNVEKQVKLDLEKKKMIFCSNEEDYKSLVVEDKKVKFTNLTNYDRVYLNNGTTVMMGRRDQSTYHELRQTKIFNHTKVYDIRYYQKPGGINMYVGYTTYEEDV